MSTVTTARDGSRTAGGGSAARLTRRGRIAVFVALFAVFLVALVAVSTTVAATFTSGDPVPVRTVVVQPGETLWVIASRANPTGNVGDTVHEIAELNALPTTGELQIGQQIAVPRYGAAATSADSQP